MNNSLKKTENTWLVGDSDNEVVLASRVRLARNFVGIPFPNRANAQQLEAVLMKAGDAFCDIENALKKRLDVLDIEKLGSLERQVLIEKQLIRRQMVVQPKSRAVFMDRDETAAVMVNEEDHLRIHCMGRGLCLEKQMERAFAIDDAIEASQDIAFDEKLGYITSCPTNLGTGLRATAVLHLPGLFYTQNMQNITTVSQQLGLSVRPLFGKGNESKGNLYIIANQMTLGFSEQGIIDNIVSAVQGITDNELRARKALQMFSGVMLENSARRALGIMKYSSLLEWDEAMEFISKIRLGIDMGYITEVSCEDMGRLIIAIQPAYIKYMRNNENMSPTELGKARADLVQAVLAGRGADYCTETGEKYES